MKHLSLDYSRGIPFRIHRRERNAAIEDLEVWFVRQHQVTFAVVWHCLRKSNNRIVVDDGTTFKCGGVAEGSCAHESGCQ